jgi:RimJ/RimL family protein N-acetyltransferase
MPETAKYSTVQALRDGRPVKIRALKPEDRADLLAAIDRTSAQSLYRRFFAVKRGFSETEETFFLNIDFADHVALVAVVDEEGRQTIVGGGRYVVLEPGRAEVAFVVIDQYQGQGVGSALMQHLAAIARGAGLQELVAEVLPDNTSMLKVFEKSGLRISTKRESGVVHVVLRLV